ncbi:MAG TPA: DUF2007 domain-containing protein [Bacteroidia bacterium]
MKEMVTVLTCNYPQECAVAKALLESFGIFVFVKNEFSIQVAPLYSKAMGGIELQVLSNDYNVALDILKEHQLMPKQSAQTQSPFYKKIIEVTANWVVFKKMNTENRFLLFLIISVIIVVLLAYGLMNLFS